MSSKKDSQQGSSRDFDRLVSDIYDSALVPGQVQEILCHIKVYLGASAYSLFRLDGDASGHPAASTDGLSEEWLKAYESHWWQHDAWIQSAQQQNLIAGGTTLMGAQLVQRRDLIKTPWYNDGLAPNNIRDVLCTSLWQEGSTSPRMALSFYRSQDSEDFDNEERQQLARLAHHLIHALKVAETLGLLHQDKVINEALMNGTRHGVLLFGEDRKILFMNPAAEEALHSSSIELKLRNDRLQTLGIESSPTLDEAFELVDRGLIAPMIFITERGPRGPRMASAKLIGISDVMGHSLHHTRPRYLLLLETGQRHEATALHLFGRLFHLTAAEQRVLSLVMEDATPNEIAEHLGIQLPTVRTHIQRILQKTGSKRITHLIRRVTEIRLCL